MCVVSLGLAGCRHCWDRCGSCSSSCETVTPQPKAPPAHQTMSGKYPSSGQALSIGETTPTGGQPQTWNNPPARFSNTPTAPMYSGSNRQGMADSSRPASQPGQPITPATTGSTGTVRQTLNPGGTINPEGNSTPSSNPVGTGYPPATTTTIPASTPVTSVPPSAPASSWRDVRTTTPPVERAAPAAVPEAQVEDNPATAPSPLAGHHLDASPLQRRTPVPEPPDPSLQQPEQPTVPSKVPAPVGDSRWGRTTTPVETADERQEALPMPPVTPRGPATVHEVPAPQLPPTEGPALDPLPSETGPETEPLEPEPDAPPSLPSPNQ
jgi:hypothetical protein